MQQGLILPDLARRLAAEKTEKKDLIINTAHTRLVAAGHEAMFLEHRDPDNRETEWTGELRPLAHDQIADHTGVPLKYYKRMHSEAPDLLARNVNEWFRRGQSLRMLRTMRGAGRAFLSNRYLRVENDVIAELALGVLQDKGVDLSRQIVSCNVTETKLYIEATIPGLEAEVKGSPRVGDIVRGGVVITNSEVGRGRVDVSEFDYYLWCTNGAVGQSLFKKTHTGGAIVDNDALLADDTKRTMDNALMLQVRDMIAAALDVDRFRARMERASDLTKLGIKGNPADSIQMLTSVLGPTVGLTEKEEGGILSALISQQAGATAYGLMQAVTAQANTTEDYDRAIELQAAGGKLLELPRSEWERILDTE